MIKLNNINQAMSSTKDYTVFPVELQVHQWCFNLLTLESKLTTCNRDLLMDQWKVINCVHNTFWCLLKLCWWSVKLKIHNCDTQICTIEMIKLNYINQAMKDTKDDRLCSRCTFCVHPWCFDWSSISRMNWTNKNTIKKYIKWSQGIKLWAGCCIQK